MKKLMMFLIALALVAGGLAFFPRATAAQNPAGICPPPSHPKMSVEFYGLGTVLDNPNLYPGVKYYFAITGETDAQIAQAHALGLKVIGMTGIWSQEAISSQNATAVMMSLASMGYDMIVVDEPVHWLKNYLGYPNLAVAAAKAVEVLNPAFVAVKASYPNITVGVVEPYKAYLWSFMQAGGNPDFVAGEDYANWWGDIRQPDLDVLKTTYGVQTQQWVMGVNEIMAYEGKVDLVIAADVNGDWGDYFRAFKYADALKVRLNQSCSVFLPLVPKSP